MYAGSFATSRIGRKVSGSATTEKITEYSVSITGSSPVMHDREREHEEDDPGEREARGACRPLLLAPLPAEELRQVVRAREARLDRGAADGEEDPDEREQSPNWPSACLRAERRRPEELRVDPAGRKSTAATIISANERNAPSP